MYRNRLIAQNNTNCLKVVFIWEEENMRMKESKTS